MKPNPCFFGGLPLLLWLCAGTGCTQFQPAPLDLTQDSVAWRTTSLEQCRGKKCLSAEDLLHIGLLMNPELNKARLTYAKSTEVHRFAGLWDDPTLSADMERISGGPVSSRSLAPGITIPVTGSKRLAAKAAEQYAESDFRQMQAEELDYSRRLADKILEVRVAHARLELMQQRRAVLKREKEQADRLKAAGEIDLTDYHIICRRFGDSEQELQQQETTHLKLHQELLALVGLHPAVGDIEISGQLPQSLPPSPALPTDAELLNAPAVLALSAAYGASETELKAEIRKQYPDITLSPGYMREDRENKVTLGAELNIPLWNRNREAIAKAQGDRKLKEHETLTAWRNLLRERDDLSARCRLAESHCRDELERVRLLRQAMQQQEQLFAVGETTLPSLSEARHEAYQRSLNLLDIMQELISVQNALSHLTLPS